MPDRDPTGASLDAPRRVLVREVNWLGDLVISLPALAAVRRRFPEASLSVLVRRSLAGFFDGFDWIDEVLPFEVRGGPAGLADRAGIVRRLRTARFDLALLLPKSFESALWAAAAGIPRRVGWAVDARSWLLTDAVAETPAARAAHQSDAYLELVRTGLGAEGSREVTLPVAAGHRRRMDEWLAARRRRPGLPLVAVAAAAAYGPAKEWPEERWAELVDRLSGRAEVVLVGAPGEVEKCRRIAGAARDGALVAAGETSVGELVALLAIADAFAGNDSGAMHVAAAVGTPTIGVFGSTSPERTGPSGRRTRVLRVGVECSPCLERTCRFGHYECLRRIGVDDVEAALDRALSAADAP